MHVSTEATRHMRTLVAILEERLRILHLWCDEDARLGYRELATRTAELSLATIDLYEEDPFPERTAIGAMYRACEAGLALVELLADLSLEGKPAQVLGWTIRDLRELIGELFDWVVPAGPRAQLARTE